MEKLTDPAMVGAPVMAPVVAFRFLRPDPPNHAYGLALKTMQRYTGDSVEKMTIQVLHGGNPIYRRIVVTSEKFEAWLALDEPLDRVKQYTLMLLGRIPPDRDFTRGIKAR